MEATKATDGYATINLFGGSFGGWWRVVLSHG
jgi:hypothetical protein